MLFPHCANALIGKNVVTLLQKILGRNSQFLAEDRDGFIVGRAKNK
jgi:hypothetical protein